MKISEKLYATSRPEYSDAFWRSMRGDFNNTAVLNDGFTEDGTRLFPGKDAAAFAAALKAWDLFRVIGTVKSLVKSDGVIHVSDSDDVPEWVPEGQQISLNSEDFSTLKYSAYKLAILSTLSQDFIADTGFDLKEYIISRFSKSFGKAEENAFINGTGSNMPKGILHETAGAETGVTISGDITFDDVLKLYFSVEKQYRANGVWLMNDETALALKTLKSEYGLYLWNQNSDTILGKPVHISEYMPSDGKPVAFGDFSYYNVIDRMPMSVLVLNEAYALNQKIGFLGVERLDGVLIRTEAIKVLSKE